MKEIVDTGYWVLATATLLAQALTAALIGLAVLARGRKQAPPLYSLVRENAYTLVFLSTLIATLGSLFFSEIAKFAPCVLCWYQRIFIYPQALLTYLAIMRSEAWILRPYLLALNVAGLVFSAYHNFILLFPQYHIFECTTTGGPSCIAGYKFYYGYITIPLMALTVLIFNIVVLWLYGRPDAHSSVRKPN
jgi:disulfide bond formation protein DsbB